MTRSDHDYFMGLAISLAETARDIGEVPVGAVVVHQGSVISTGFNMRETNQSPLCHAEIVAIDLAAKNLNSWRLLDCQLYVTLEPCLMCAGALYQARISKVFFGTKDPKGGALGSLYSIHEDPRLNHRFEVHSGCQQLACSQLLKNFFRSKRL